MRKTLVLLIVLFGVSGVARSQQQSGSKTQESKPPSASAQENKVPPAAQEPAQQVAEGALSKVDEQKQLIWIKTQDGKEMQFVYSKDTQVEGAGATVEGLASMPASDLKVYYRTEGGINIATRIEVLARKG